MLVVVKTILYKRTIGPLALEKIHDRLVIIQSVNRH